MIINMKVPVVDSNGMIVYEQRSILTETLEGQPSHVIPQLFALYFGSQDLRQSGATVSFIHTHPSSEKFSGEEGKTYQDIIGQLKKYILNWDKTHFSHYVGDSQVPWLPGVDKMYLVSPSKNEIYACDANGPIMNSMNPSKYDIRAYY